VLDFENNRLQTVATSNRMPEEEVLPSETELFSTEDPHTIFIDMRKIGQGYLPTCLSACRAVALALSTPGLTRSLMCDMVL